MEPTRYKLCFRAFVVLVICTFVACTLQEKNNSSQMKNALKKGTYGFDAAFLTANNIAVIELMDPDSEARVLIAPGLQGRVMTSSASGEGGSGFGWINHSFIASGKSDDQFNPYGGEERLWLGPEGGPFSIYFEQGEEQIFPNWNVPKEIDTETFEITSQNPQRVSFRKSLALRNASGTNLNIGIERSVRIMTRQEASRALNVDLDDSLSCVGYESENILINQGKTGWNRNAGALSIWMLSMFNPSEKGVVFIPFKTGEEEVLGKIVTDDYFGKVPSDRLIISDGIILFKTDGKFRSKIGVSPQRALPKCGSYDPDRQTLTLLLFSLPDHPSAYLNSKWGSQDDPYLGDAVNSYNDGPVEDGSIMGPFYEIESSSPAAFLSPGESMSHTQRIFHITGDEQLLTLITEKLFQISIDEIKQAFCQEESIQSEGN